MCCTCTRWLIYWYQLCEDRANRSQSRPSIFFWVSAPPPWLLLLTEGTSSDDAKGKNKSSAPPPWPSGRPAFSSPPPPPHPWGSIEWASVQWGGWSSHPAVGLAQATGKWGSCFALAWQQAGGCAHLHPFPALGSLNAKTGPAQQPQSGPPPDRWAWYFVLAPSVSIVLSTGLLPSSWSTFLSASLWSADVWDVHYAAGLPWGVYPICSHHVWTLAYQGWKWGVFRPWSNKR